MGQEGEGVKVEQGAEGVVVEVAVGESGAEAAAGNLKGGKKKRRAAVAAVEAAARG